MTFGGVTYRIEDDAVIFNILLHELHSKILIAAHQTFSLAEEKKLK